MHITAEHVQHIARLARLGLTADEAQTLGQELSAILGYVEKLAELDTMHVAPTTHAVATPTVLRPDEARHGLGPEQVLGNAPASQDGHFRVPKVVEGQG